MSLLAFVDNGTVSACPIGLSELQSRYPSVSFSLPLRADDLAAYGVAEAEPSPPPEVNNNLEKINGFEWKKKDGKWIQSWIVIPLSDEEKEERFALQTSAMRTHRNVLLQNCDWTQLPDAPVDAAAWASYRQALRDVTSQPGFPWDVQWPEAPVQ